MAETFIYPHDSEIIYNVVNETAKIPGLKILGILNNGPAKLVRVAYLTATNTGRYSVVKEKDIVINTTGDKDTLFEIPQDAVERGRIVVYNDTDVNATVTYSFLE